MNPSLISVFSAVAAAVWSVWTWQSEQQKLRETRRNEMSAQYVNNFIMVTQDLQRRIFKLLEEDELSYYMGLQHTEFPSPVAVELLFCLSAFFGWELMTYRFGPYTRDPNMIAIMAQIGEVLETRTCFPGQAFRLTLGDRHALGQASVRRVGETSSGPAFITLSRFKFEEEMADEHSEWSKLFGSDRVRGVLAAVDRAVAGEPLEGRERLAALQNLLVDLLSYLEMREGFSVHFGERQRATVENKNIRANVNADVVLPLDREVRILHQVAGRIRLGIPYLHADKTYASRLQALLQAVDYVRSARVNVDAACVVVEYSGDIFPTDFVQMVVASIESDIEGVLADEKCTNATPKVTCDALKASLGRPEPELEPC